MYYLIGRCRLNGLDITAIFLPVLHASIVSHIIWFILKSHNAFIVCALLLSILKKNLLLFHIQNLWSKFFSKVPLYFSETLLYTCHEIFSCWKIVLLCYFSLETKMDYLAVHRIHDMCKCTVVTSNLVILLWWKLKELHQHLFSVT